MEDTFQFIIESPQHNTGHKKRPRLVTSCDNCRLKKIKCLQPSPETKCEACKAAKIACRFKDRERYFAERSRAIAGPSVNGGAAYGGDQRHDSNPSLDAFSVASSSSSPSLSNAALRSNSHSPKANGLVSAEGDANGRYPYPPDPRRGDPNQRHSANSSISSFHSRSNSYGYAGYVGSPAPVPHPNSRPPAQVDYRHVQLFEPERPGYPHHTLMPHFIQVFFEHLGPEFPYLTYEQLISENWDNRLSSPLSNAVAALASRYSNVPELTIRGLHNVAEQYTDAAKTAVNSVLHIASLETLHALLLLAWSEYRNSRLAESRHFTNSAVQMAQDLRLQDSESMQLPDAERRRRSLTWAHILQLHAMTANRA